MKKKTVDLLTTIMAMIFFIFGLAAYWFEKMDGVMLIPVVVVSIALITFKNEKFEKFINAILKIK